MGNGRRLIALVVAVALTTGAMAASATASGRVHQGDGNGGCRLEQTSGRGIEHVVYVVWDNTHLLRDNPNVPSDLQQMPHLLNFLRDNGTLSTQEHTPLIAHTANDVVTSLTGLYPDQQGLNVANSYGYFNANGSITFPSAFTYWTDPVQTSATPNPPYNLVTAQGKNAPAPWVPFTRAGCNVGAIASGDISLENTSTSPSGDITRIFGSGSPLWNEAKKENGATAPHGLASANFEGLAVHCAAASPVCSSGVADSLPDEPGGYHGYKGLFGAVQVNPALGAGADTNSGGYLRARPLTALDGTPITDDTGNGGFPGFDAMTPNISLGIVASMLEHGVPVTYSYLTDAHDNQTTGNASGPGSSDYVARLHTYDQAFGRFFARLAHDGINKSNTLFVFTADEGDHFVGAQPTNPGCDGVNVACQYDPSKVGEIDGDLAPLLQSETGNTTPFAVHNDSAPVFYINGNPGATSPVTRQLERDTAVLHAFDPISNRQVALTNYLADPTELKLLHMETGDPRRNPSFVMFANPNYYLDATNQYGCPAGAAQPGCIYQYSGDAYNHGDVSAEINRTWLGMVGPGVRPLGQTGTVWSDHTDDRPTMLKILGLRDDYTSQGLVLTQFLDPSVTGETLRSKAALALQRVYTQLEAPVGQFGLITLEASTGSLASATTGDAAFAQCTAQLTKLGQERDALGQQIQSLLSASEFGGAPIDREQAWALTHEGERILDSALSTQELCTT